MMRSTRVRIAAAVATIAMVVTTTAPAFATTLNLVGSTTLAPLAQKWALEYKASHSGTSISVSGGGSQAGVNAAEAGTAVGMCSRSQNIAGRLGATTSDPADLVFTPVARDALTIVINASFHKKYPKYIYRLSAMQVQGIFKGDIKNWKQINPHLPSHSIDLEGRTGTSGTYTYFKQMFMTNGTVNGEIGSVMYTQSSRVHQYVSNGMVHSAVAGDMYSIGYLSEAFVDSKVTALNLQAPAHYYDASYTEHTTSSSLAGKWIVPSLANALNGTYLYVRPLYFVTKGTPAADSLAAKFIAWCLSSTGQSYAPGQHFLKLH
jgi:phosphate transport system substrate-binding protein